jgi:hypothetical protein
MPETDPKRTRVGSEWGANNPRERPEKPLEKTRKRFETLHPLIVVFLV